MRIFILKRITVIHNKKKQYLLLLSTEINLFFNIQFEQYFWRMILNEGRFVTMFQVKNLH